jgi:hypothetical protein
MSYDASAGVGDRRSLLLQEAPNKDALRVAVVPCTSAIRLLLAFSTGHHPAHNFLVKRVCCRFAQVIGITSYLRITFPCLLKICASTLGLCAVPGPDWRRHYRLEGPLNLLARGPSVITSVGIPIKPS